MALAILFAIAGTSFIDAKASNGSCNKHRHLKTSGGGCKTSCKKGKCKNDGTCPCHAMCGNSCKTDASCDTCGAKNPVQK